MALILGVKVVEDAGEAIAHIHEHGSEHSDGILTNDWHNATGLSTRSTRRAFLSTPARAFNDGGQFGLGGRWRSARKSCTPAVRWGLRN